MQGAAVYKDGGNCTQDVQDSTRISVCALSRSLQAIASQLHVSDCRGLPFYTHVSQQCLSYYFYSDSQHLHFAFAALRLSLHSLNSSITFGQGSSAMRETHVDEEKNACLV